MSEELSKNFNKLHPAKQVTLMAGLALSVFLGIKVAFWSFDQAYRPLVTGLPAKKNIDFSILLDQSEIAQKHDIETNTIYVPVKHFVKARRLLIKSGFDHQFSDKTIRNEDIEALCDEHSDWQWKNEFIRPILGLVLIFTLMIGVVRPTLRWLVNIDQQKNR